MASTERGGRPIEVYVETGRQRVFACAFEWPGWCRSGKDEERAVDALAAAAPRYAVVAGRAGASFPAATRADLTVTEHVRGGAATDFGVPYEVPARDAQPISKPEADRQAALIEASWAVLDEVAAAAPTVLRKGPRGGGRDRDAIAEHVVNAEVAYAAKLGLRLRAPSPGDRTAVNANRDALLQALRTAFRGGPLPAKGWPPRYAARRIAWHILDHAWEIEDRSTPAPG